MSDYNKGINQAIFNILGIKCFFYVLYNLNDYFLGHAAKEMKAFFHCIL